MHLNSINNITFVNVVLSGCCKPHGKSHGRELHLHVGCSNKYYILFLPYKALFCFFSQCLLRSSWALLNCSSFIFISYKGNSASFPIFQFLIAKNAHRLSRLLDHSYRIAQFLPRNDMHTHESGTVLLTINPTRYRINFQHRCV